jgi:arylsulfatase A-like enzyme
VAPTLLDLCGVESPAAMEGVSLAAQVRGESLEGVRDFVVCEECTWQMKWALRTGSHKFIRALEPDFYGTPMRELYDLRQDPGEFTNVVDDSPELAAELGQQLDQWLREMMGRKGLGEDPLRAHGLTLGKRWQGERGT